MHLEQNLAPQEEHISQLKSPAKGLVQLGLEHDLRLYFVFVLTFISLIIFSKLEVDSVI